MPQSTHTDQSGEFSFRTSSLSGFQIEVSLNGLKVGFRTEDLSSSHVRYIRIFLEPPLNRETPAPTKQPLVSVRELAIPGKALQAFQHGVRELNQSQVEHSLSDFQKAIELYRDYDEAYVQLGLAYYLLGKWSDAAAVLERGVEVYAANARAHALLGKVLLRQTKLSEAMSHLKEALRVDDRLWSAHIDLGNVLLKAGNTDEAYEHALRAQELKPEKLESHLLLYNTFIRQSALDKALSELDGMIARFGDLPIGARFKQMRDTLAQRVGIGSH